MSDPISLADRAVGCLLGLACGDALGGPVEFIDRAKIAAIYPGGLRDFVGGGWLHLAPGEITDDTQMTLALARSLIANGLDPARMVAEFLAWYSSNSKDIGNTTRAALALLADGVSPEEAGARVTAEMGDSRCRQWVGDAVCASRYPVVNDPDGLVSASIASAAITHADRRCTWGAVAINQAIAHLLRGGGLDGVVDAAIGGVSDSDVRAAVLGAADRPREHVKSGGFVLDTVGAALWCLLSQDGYQETVVAAVSLGDDTDTTAAVAGALAGAHYGIAAIPPRWRDFVQHRDEIRDLALRLMGYATGAPA